MSLAVNVKTRVVFENPPRCQYKRATFAMPSQWGFMLGAVDHCERRIAAAEMEIKALIYVIDGAYGTFIASIAAEYWLEELDMLDLASLPEGPNWRKCTTATVSRLYRDGHLI